MKMYIILLSSLVLSLVLTPFIRKFAIKVRALDHPNHRKVHKHAIPRLGGVAIFLASFLPLIAYTYFFDPKFTWMAIAMFVVFVTDLVDDFCRIFFVSITPTKVYNLLCLL